MDDFILHHYWGSPYGEKVRLILGFKRLPWRSVEIPFVMPRPLLMPLTGGYRRSPILQVGADVYCDTRRMALFLEERAPEPTLFPAGSRAIAELFSNWVEPRIFLSSGPVRFQSAQDLDCLTAGCVTAEAFVADRTPFMQPALNVWQGPALVPAALDQLRCFLGTVNELLADGRPFLAGDRLSLADFSAYPTVWWLRPIRHPRLPGADQTPSGGSLLREFPAVATWAERVGAVGHGTYDELSAERALSIAQRCEPRAAAASDPWDAAGRQLGSTVTVSADDYGREEVRGCLVGLSRDDVSIGRIDANAGNIVTHFPRIGFRVLPAST